MEIRKLHPSDDLFAVSRVYEESWREVYRGLLPQEYLDSIQLGKWVPYLEQAGRESLLLLEGEKIVGTTSCCASRTPELSDWGEIVSLYLLPEYWGNGWGKALLSAAVEQLESMGYQDFFLWVLFFRTDRLAGVRSMRAASSPRLILRRAIKTSRLTTMGMVPSP